ncbi:unnamed protein product [Peronospora effusa]|nr:unnamed protein product [Peronospora effusa]
MPPSSVQSTSLSVTQETLLNVLERHVQLKTQAETHASILRLHRRPETLKTLRELFQTQQVSKKKQTKSSVQLDPSFVHLRSQMDTCMSQWDRLYTHAHASHALVVDMEASHVQVVTKTQALYRTFETNLQQIEALDARVAVIAAPMPHFTAIDTIAQALGFGVKFATPSNDKKLSNQVETTRRTGASSTAFKKKGTKSSQAVQVYQHRREIDPTTKGFEQALEKIDTSVAFLTKHAEYKDSACYIDAYRTLAAGGIQALKDYALSGLDAAKDAVYEALQKEVMKSQHSSVTTLSGGQLDETSAYYVNFQLVAPALAAVAKQLERLNALPPQDSAENLRVLGEVVDAYASQRVQLLSPVFGTWLSALSQTSDIVNVLRATCAQLLKVCEAELRLFLKLFGHDPSDEVFVFSGIDIAHKSEPEEREDDTENAFERLIFQLSGLLYNTMRPQVLIQQDLEVLCEVIQILRSEVIEAAITPRVALVGYAEPVMHRMIQDAQERLILCMQKYIRDEIEGFVPTPADLDYPAKLVTAEQTSASLYATWYPSLEHTLMCLSKGYHYVKMEIFEELAQDAIQICAASLKMASAEITATQGGLHGSLFLVKHLLTLREQITPFEIQFAQTSKALDFTSSADAMNELLADTSTLFRFSGPNGIMGLFVRGIPHIQETTADVKKKLEHELKKSCTCFIEIVLQQLAGPLLTLMKQVAHVQHTQKATALDFRQCAFAAPTEVNNVLVGVSHQLRDTLPEILQTIHLYLRNSSTETILFKPVQRNLLAAVESLNSLMEQIYTRDELQPCEEVFEIVLQQLRAL